MTDIDKLMSLFDPKIRVTSITCFEEYSDRKINLFVTGKDMQEIGVSVSMLRKAELMNLFPDAVVFEIPKQERRIVKK